MTGRKTLLVSLAVAAGGLGVAIAFGVSGGRAHHAARIGVHLVQLKPLPKVYDAASTATVDFSGARLVGILSGDDVSIDSNGYSASFSNANVRTKAVGIYGLRLVGRDAAKYRLVQPTGASTITAKTLTISGSSSQDKVYDGTANSTLTHDP
jgi:hypothetical protein